MRMRLLRGLALPLLAAACAVAGVRFAHAGIQSADCRHPYVFSDGAVNLVVLPYDYHSVTRNAKASDAADQIPLLLQANGLLQMLRYGGVGSLNLVNPFDDPSCRPEIVLEALTAGEVRPGRVLPGHGLILVWGTLYEEGDEFQVQTFMRILRRDRDESLTVQLHGKDSMVVRPSTTTLAFAPQTLSRADLDEIGTAFRKAVEVRTKPSSTAALSPFTFYDPHGQGSAYSVTNAKGEWLQVEDRGGRSGWIRAGFNGGAGALSARLPEAEFIGLAAGYLRARVAAERRGDRAPKGTLAWVRQSLNGYLAAAGPDADDVAGAVGQQLVALTACVQARDGSPEWLLADSCATRAAEALPNDPQAQRMAGAMTLRADGARGDVAKRSRLVERRLARAAVVDGPEGVGLRDLQTLYSLVKASDDGAIADAKLSNKVAAERLQTIIDESKTVPSTQAPH